MEKYKIDVVLLFEDWQEWQIRKAFDEMFSDMSRDGQSLYSCPIHHLPYKPATNALYCPADLCPYHRHTITTNILDYLK